MTAASKQINNSKLNTKREDFQDSLPGEISESKVWIVLPAYNEEVGVVSLINKIIVMAKNLHDAFEILVIDDGSTDATAQVVSQLSFHHPVTLVQHKKNQGLAGALRSGFDHVLRFGNSSDKIVTMDADDTQPPATIPKMLTMIDEGFDVVIASRYQPGSRTVGVPKNRLALTWLAKWIFKSIMPIPGVWDYTCGFRAYDYDKLRESYDHYGDEFVSEKGFSCMVDVLLKMRKFTPIIGEVPMLLRYDQKHGSSKMDVAQTTTKTIRLLIRRRFGK